MDKSTCRNDQYNFMVQRDIYKCVECNWVQPAYCEGMHDCLYMPNSAGWNNALYVQPKDKSEFEGDVQYFENFQFERLPKVTQRRGLSDKLAVVAALYAFQEEMLRSITPQNSVADSRIYETVKSMALYTSDAERWNPSRAFTEFNGASNIQHDNSLPVPVNNRRCESVTEQVALEISVESILWCISPSLSF